MACKHMIRLRAHISHLTPIYREDSMHIATVIKGRSLFRILKKRNQTSIKSFCGIEMRQKQVKVMYLTMYIVPI